MELLLRSASERGQGSSRGYLGRNVVVHGTYLAYFSVVDDRCRVWNVAGGDIMDIAQMQLLDYSDR